MSSYYIPEEIDNKIPKYFYIAFLGELLSVFGVKSFLDVYNLYQQEGYVNYFSSSFGWAEAFYATCKKLNIDWLFDYYHSLKWYDSDVFDSIIESRLKYLFDDNEISPYNIYMSWRIHYENNKKQL